MSKVNKKRLKQLESKLTIEQIEGARLLAQNNFLKKVPENANPDEINQGKEDGVYRLTLAEIAEKVGVATKTIYNWRTNNSDFTSYVNVISEEFFLAHLPDIMNKHLEMTLKGQGSMKGIELFYKFGGLLADRTQVEEENTESDDATLKEKVAELKKRAQEGKRKTS